MCNYCNDCGILIEEGHPHCAEGNKYFCWDCSFKKGLIDEEEYMQCSGIGLDGYVPIVKNGEVVIVSNSYKRKMETREERRTPEYRLWRDSVYKRDNYTCQHCGQIGGDLEAHHIESFAKHKEKRIDVNNGITLCKKCHKELHKRMRNEKGLH